jgi:hypothetical protein
VNARRFNAICIGMMVIVTVIAMTMVYYGPGGLAGEDRHIDLSKLSPLAADASENPFLKYNINTGLAVAVIGSFGLMTVGLVVLFQDGPMLPHRRRR